MPEYTFAAVVSAVLVVIWELALAKTGVFKLRAYWVAMAIVFFFQVLVDGWLTKLSAPIVSYAEHETLGIRFPWDIPVEDYLFGFALVTLAIVSWLRSRS